MSKVGLQGPISSCAIETSDLLHAQAPEGLQSSNPPKTACCSRTNGPSKPLISAIGFGSSPIFVGSKLEPVPTSTCQSHSDVGRFRSALRSRSFL